MFSLVDDPWIQIVDAEGDVKLVGISEVFDGRVSALRVQGDSPAQDYAVTRLLLAIFWRAHVDETHVRPGKTFNFSDWFQRTRKQILNAGADKKVAAYLDRYCDRFELVDSKTPFMQVEGLHVGSGEVKHVTTIVPESQGAYFSMRAGRSRDSLSFAEAARWLVYAQAYDYSGIKPGAVGDSRVKNSKGYPIGTGWTGMTGGTLVMGANLLDTLILNTVREAITDPDDRPVWERRPDGPDVRSAVGEKSEPQGPADLATWQSRRIRLHSDGEKVTGVVLCNGDKIPEAGANVLSDPMTPYRYSANKSKKDRSVFYPRPYDVERTMWKSLEPLVVAETDAGFSEKALAPKRPATLNSLAKLSQNVEGIPRVLELVLCSVEYGPQSSSVATTYSARMSLPLVVLLESSAYLRNEVREVAAVTTNAAIALGRFAGNLLVAAGGDYGFKTAVTDRVLAELEPQFNEWLRGIAKLPDDSAHSENEAVRAAVEQWQFTVRRVIDEHARVLLRGAGPKAFSGRVIPTGSEDSRGRFVSAASCYHLLHSSLDKVLPATSASKKSAKQNLQRGDKE